MLWLVDLLERTYNDWLVQLSDYRCPITANSPITLSRPDYNFGDQLEQNTAVYHAPITFEEIVTVMIYHRKSKGLRG